MTQDFKINNFDLLRIFAATQVLFNHSYKHLHIPYPIWYNVIASFPGVTMFFVMSGFLISASLERNPDLKNYFTNRALRIYPALWFVVLLSIATIWIAADISFINRETIPWMICQFIGFIYTPAFLSHYGFGSYNGSLWTIPLELQFYLVLPIIYYFSTLITSNSRQKTIILTIVFTIFCLLAYYILEHYTRINLKLETKFQKILRYTFIPHIYMFLAGVVLQRIKAYNSVFIYGKGILWILSYLLFCYFVPASNLTVIIRNLFLAVTLISVAYSLPGVAHKLLRGNDISYGVYIYHGLVLSVLVHMGLTGNSYYVFLILIITYILSFLSWRFIEKPFLGRKRKTIHAVAL